MRDLQVIGEHTVDVALLQPDDRVLDAGCRDFTFARELSRRGCRVIALDADPTVADPREERITFLNVAIGVQSGRQVFAMTADPQARHLAFDSTLPGGPYCEVGVVDVDALMKAFGVAQWAVVKLDVEGAEYEILRKWPGPISRQISIEFHEHVAQRPQGLYDTILKHLGQWYEVAQHEKSARHCTHPNYWDSLFILRSEYRA